MKTAILAIILVLLAAILPTNAEAAGAVVTPPSDATIRPTTRVKRPMVIDFNAKWCGPCNAMAPVFKAVAAQYKDKADFVGVDIERYPKTTAAFGLEAVPTIVILLPGKKPVTAVGAQWLNEADPAAAFAKYIKSVTGL